MEIQILRSENPPLLEHEIDRKLDPTQPVPFDEAVVLGKRGAPVGNQNARKADEASAVSQQNKGSNTTIVLGRGSDYTLARLRRDRRHLTKSQRAMWRAKQYPDASAKGGRGKKTASSGSGFTTGEISKARTVLQVVPEFAEQVLAGELEANIQQTPFEPGDVT